MAERTETAGRRMWKFGEEVCLDDVVGWVEAHREVVDYG